MVINAHGLAVLIPVNHLQRISYYQQERFLFNLYGAILTLVVSLHTDDNFDFLYMQLIPICLTFIPFMILL